MLQLVTGKAVVTESQAGSADVFEKHFSLPQKQYFLRPT